MLVNKMRSTFLKFIFSALILQSFVLYAFEKNFGYEVVECMSKIHPPLDLDSQELAKIFSQCEKEVTEKRSLKDHVFSDRNVNSDVQQEYNPFSIENLPPESAPIDTNPFSERNIQQGQDVRLNMGQAIDKTPPQSADAYRIAKETNTPVSAVLNNMEEMQRQQLIDRYVQSTKDAPVTQNLLKDPDKAAFVHEDIQNMTYIEMFVDSMFFWIGENALSIGLAVVGYLIRGVVGAVIASIPTSLITGFGVYEIRYFKDHGIDYSDVVRFARMLNDPIFMNEAKTYAIFGSIQFSLLNAIVIFFFFSIISSRSSIYNLCKKCIDSFNNCSFDGNLTYVFDLIFLIGIPFSIVTLLDNNNIIEDDIKTALIVALITAIIAYCSIFTFQGYYTSTPFRLRLSVFQPVLFISIIYWLGMVLTEISDGKGSGNVLTMLFGLTVVSAVAWNRIKKLDQSK